MGTVSSFAEAQERRFAAALQAGTARAEEVASIPRHPGINAHAASMARLIERHSRLVAASMNFGDGCRPEQLAALDSLEQRITEAEFHLPPQVLMDALSDRRVL